MDDLISRQKAINEIEFGIIYAKAINKKTGEVKELFQERNDELRWAAERIKQLPSVQPEREKGKWVDAQYPFSKCSICECYFDTVNNLANFCPCCGADMRDDKHDT